MERVIDPTIADLQTEYEDAVNRGRRLKAARIWIVGHIAILRVTALQGALNTLEPFRDLPGDDRRAVLRTMAASCVIAIGGTLALAVVPFANFASRGVSSAVELALYLVPQAFPLTVPMGMTFGILWGLGRVSASFRTVSVVLLLALGASLMSFATVAWVLPISNHAFRTSIAGQQLPKGDSELTINELRHRLESGIATPSDSRRLALTYHARWAIAAAPLVLGAFAVAFTTRRPWGLMSFAAGCFAVFVYCLFIVSARGLGVDRAMSPFAAAWLPNATFLVLSMAITKFGAQRTDT